MPTTAPKSVTKKSATTKSATKKSTTAKPSAKTSAAKSPAKSSVKSSTKKVAKSTAKKPAAQAVKVDVKVAVKVPAKSPVQKGAAKKTAATTATAAPGLIAVGELAPDFRAVDAAGKTITRASMKGKSFVLYFYPQDDTPGCTVEACAFRDNRPKFAKLNCPVLGVSPDSPESHRKFDAKYSLGFTLLADAPGADGVPPVAAAFGVWQEKSMYGRKYMGIVRTTYVIDGRGRVAARFDKVKVEGHADAVLDAVSALGR
jgi:peroxiredoxin Q/BCP